ncbi:MAG: CTP synthase [Verrucomicrobiota bacterium]
MGRNLYIIGEFAAGWEPHEATNRAIVHSAAKIEIDVEPQWLSSENLDPQKFRQADALWIAPGSPYKNLENTIETIRIARENNIPTLGTCGGFQYMIVEYARNVLGLPNAQHMEHDADASELFISKLACSLLGQTLPINLIDNSQVQRIYSASRVEERYYCQFGINPEFTPALQAKGDLTFPGTDDEGELRILERPSHPFFIGTLFVPQTRSASDQPHPIVTALLQSTLK